MTEMADIEDIEDIAESVATVAAPVIKLKLKPIITLKPQPQPWLAQFWFDLKSFPPVVTIFRLLYASHR